MKTIHGKTALLFSFILLLSCGDKGEKWEEFTIIKELELSVPTMEESQIEIDEVDFEFEILDGNGEYTVSLPKNSEDNARASISGNKVTVNLLSQRPMTITVTDKEQKEAVVSVRSTHPSLEHCGISNGITLDIGKKYEAKIIASGMGAPFQTAAPFGAGGPYTVERIRGNSAEVYIINDIIHTETLKFGNTDFKIRDRRGTHFRLNVESAMYLEILPEERSLDIEGDNNLSVYVDLEWGDKWEVVTTTKNITEYVSVARPVNVEPGSENDFYFISIRTTDKGKGKDTYTFRNSDGTTITVTMNIK